MCDSRRPTEGADSADIWDALADYLIASSYVEALNEHGGGHGVGGELRTTRSTSLGDLSSEDRLVHETPATSRSCPLCHGRGYMIGGDEEVTCPKCKGTGA